MNPADDQLPQWSPDGSEIAFYSQNGRCCGRKTEVYMMNADGTGQRRITFGSGWKYGASWSPDGTQIAYRNDSPWPSKIIVSDKDGSGAHAITGSNWDEGPDWSHDGSKVAFHGKPTLWTSTWDIWVVNSDGTGGRTNVTNTPGVSEVGPRWSADGKIAFYSNASGNDEIWVMNADGSGHVNLTNNPAADIHPDWSPELVAPNQPPVADAGPDASYECSGGGASATLDGSGSSDLDGDDLTYTWTEGMTVLGTTTDPTTTLTVNLSHGTHVITLTVDDGNGGSDTDDVTIEIEDTTAPVLTFSMDVTEIWPANRQMVTVASGISASDACDPSPEIDIVVTSNEPLNGPGDGNTDPDWAVIDNGDGTFDVQVRAERSGNGSGRVYTITATASDAYNNSVSATGNVTVPHDKGNGKKKGR